MAENSRFQVGSVCEAVSGTKWLAAVIASTNAESAKFNVTFLVSNETAELPASDLRPLKATHTHTLHDFPVGLRCKAKYSDDGAYYEAVIREHTPHGCIVKFKGYEETEQVPLQYLRLISLTAQAASSAESDFAVPDHLKVLPTDSEVERERKRKRIKSLKKKANLAKKDETMVQKQQGWKSFQAKSKKKRIKGSFSNLKKESMFKVPDGVGGRVGVINSGKGLTEFEQRKKVRTSAGGQD